MKLTLIRLTAAGLLASTLIGIAWITGSGPSPKTPEHARRVPAASPPTVTLAAPQRSPTRDPLAVMPSPAGGAHGTPHFVDVAPLVGLELSHDLANGTCPTMVGSGSAWADFDNDGDVDLFVTNVGGPNRLYRNDPRGGSSQAMPSFVNVAPQHGIEEAALESHAAVFIDYDNDGDQDLYVTHLGGNTLWQNRLVPEGGVSFVDVTGQANVRDAGRAITSAWGDFDGDGHLDLYLAKHADCLANITATPPDRLYHARGDGTFEDWTHYLCDDGTNNCQQINGYAFTASWLDHDNDGDADFYLVNDDIHGGGHNRHWRNDGPDGVGGWIFTEIAVAAGTATSVNGMGLGVGDLDNDGWLDLCFSNIAESHVLRNLGDGNYEDITSTCGIVPPTVSRVGWGTVFFDIENDGWLDAYVVNGPIFGSAPERNVLLQNQRDLTFVDIATEAGVASGHRGRSASIVDFDGDGFVDLFVGNLGEPPQLYRNTSHERGFLNGSVTVTVQGTDSNRDGIGTRLTLIDGNSLQIREISSGPTHGGGDYRAAYFGLGERKGAQLVVRWPNGVTESFENVPAGARLHLVEPTKR